MKNIPPSLGSLPTGAAGSSPSRGRCGASPPYRRCRQLAFARQMRREPTRSEAFLLYAVLRRDAGGFRFRRQAVVGRLIVDFLVACVGLVIEIDGSVHHGREHVDRLRQEALEASGFRIVRFSAECVERDPVAVAAQIVALVRAVKLR